MSETVPTTWAAKFKEAEEVAFYAEHGMQHPVMLGGAGDPDEDLIDWVRGEAKEWPDDYDGDPGDTAEETHLRAVAVLVCDERANLLDHLITCDNGESAEDDLAVAADMVCDELAVAHFGSAS